MAPMLTYENMSLKLACTLASSPCVPTSPCTPANHTYGVTATCQPSSEGGGSSTCVAGFAVPESWAFAVGTPNIKPNAEARHADRYNFRQVLIPFLSLKRSIRVHG